MVAKLTEESASESPRIRTTSQAGVILGTVKYMSPEQARGMQVDSRSDIYSLGAVLYEMLAGRPPFVAKGVGDLITEILNADPPSLATLNPKVHKRLRAIVKKALAKDCRARYQKTSEFTQDLLDLKNESEFRIRLREASPRTDAGEVQDVVSGTGTTRAFSGSSRFESRLWRSPRIKVGVAAFLLLSLAAGYWLRQRPVASQNRGGARSLAVLPFRNLKPDPATDFLGFSLADAIITKLGYVSALTLRPSSAVDTYRNKAVDPRVVARDLKVDTLLTGTFVRDGEDLRITTQLIDARADKILWRDAIDVKYDKLPMVQHQVSQQIINGL